MSSLPELSATAYCLARLDNLRQHAPVPCERLAEILTAICDSSSVFPTINLDGEGGVSAVWHAEGYYLEIAIERDLEAFAVAAIPGRQPKSIDLTCSKAPHRLNRIKTYLSKLTAYVNLRNPNWRKFVKSL